MKPKTALARTYRRLRLERQPKGDGTVCWMVLDESDSGTGVFGDEADGRDHYEKTVMFRALELLDPEYDWHELDWHELKGTAAERVEAMLAWRGEIEKARAETEGFHALVRMFAASAGKGS